MEAYKERMVKEYWELHERAVKLGIMLENWANGELDFEPTCPYDLLQSQLCAMDIYLNILKRRAEIENIDLGVFDKRETK
mgnify:CR=1 FL=1